MTRKNYQKYTFCNSRITFIFIALIVSITLALSLVPSGGLSFASSTVQQAYADTIEEMQQNEDEILEDFLGDEVEQNLIGNEGDSEENNVLSQDYDSTTVDFSDLDDSTEVLDETELQDSYNTSLNSKIDQLNLNNYTQADLEELSNSKNDTNNTITDFSRPQGTGTEQDPYLISNTAQFESLNTILNINPSAHIKLISDIYNDTTTNWKGFCADKNKPFCGTFDGDNHKIYLTSNGKSASSEAGLFKYVGSDACIKNLTIDADLYLKEWGAIFAGCVNENSKNVKFINCISSGQLVNNGGSEMTDGKENTRFDAVYGGIIGYADAKCEIVLENCANKAKLSADNKHCRFAGGMVGYACDNQITLNNCKNLGEVDAGAANSREFKYGIIILQIAFMIICGKLAKNYDADSIRFDQYKKHLKDWVEKKCTTGLERDAPTEAEYDFCARKLLQFSKEGTKMSEILKWSREQFGGNYNLLRHYFDGMCVRATTDCKFFCDFECEALYESCLDNPDKICQLAKKNNPLYDFYFNQDQMKEFKRLQMLPADELKAYFQNNMEGKQYWNTDFMDSNYSPISFETWEKNMRAVKIAYLENGSNSTYYFTNTADLKPYLQFANYYQKFVLNKTFTLTEQAFFDLLDCQHQAWINIKTLSGCSTFEDFDAKYRVQTGLQDATDIARDRARVINARFELNNKIAEYEANYYVANYNPNADYNSIYSFVYNIEDTANNSLNRTVNSGLLVFKNEMANIQGMNSNLPTSVYLWDYADIYKASGNILPLLDLPESALCAQVSGAATLGAINSASKMGTEAIASNLANVASSLATGEGGLGGVHWNSYGGGLIGYADGKSTDNSINIISCDNEANITGGHASGGLIAYAEEYNININSSSNLGSVGCTDNMCEPSAGGFLGGCYSMKPGQTININKSLNMGVIMSREAAGGLVGQLDDEDILINISDCGCVGGIAGTSYVGGFIGFEDSVGYIDIKNCYTYCVFDSTTLNTTQLNFSFWIPIPGLQDWTVPSTKADSTPGAFIGELDDTGRARFNNCYYLTGSRAVGPKDNSSIPFEDELHEVADDDFSKGVVTYELNNGSVSSDVAFGQVIDNLSLVSGARMYVPMPGVKAPVYKDTHSSKTVYTNYNPRTNKLYELSFFAENANIIDPAETEIYVKEGETVQFTVEVENAYLIDKVTTRSVKGEVSELKEKELDNSNSPEKKKYQYIIENVNDNLVVNVTTKAFEPSKPDGLGNFGSPYQISNIGNFVWFMSQVNSGMGNDLCAVLKNNVDVSTYKLDTMLNDVVGFAGTFDGAGHTISGISSYDANYSFFKYVDGGTIKNLTLSGTFGSAAFTDWAHDATFINCTAKGEVQSKTIAAGGICARLWGTKNLFEYCVNECNISHANNDRFTCAGGICGLLTDGTVTDFDTSGRPVCVTFRQCTNKGGVCSTSSFDTHAAGIVAYVNAWNRGTNRELSAGGTVVNIEYCENAGNIYGDGDQTSCGGIMGCIDDLDHNGDNAHINISNTINTGKIGYDTNNNKKSVQDAGGFLCWTYDRDLEVHIDNCISDGEIWMPDTTVSGGSGCGGFIANAECGKEISISNSYTTGHITSNHKYKGYVVGAWGTPVVCNIWKSLFVPWVINEAVAWTKNVFTAPRMNYSNVYVVKDGTPSYSIPSTHFYDGWVDEVDNSELYSGQLTYKINTNYKNSSHNYGQNLDMTELKETTCTPVLDENGVQVIENGVPRTEEKTETTSLNRQFSPCIMGMNSRKTVPVYQIVQGDTTFYSNYDNQSSNGEFKISVDVENGSIRGPLAGKKGEDLTINLVPKNNGYKLAEFKIDGKDVADLSELSYTFMSLDSNHDVYVRFSCDIEPERDDDINGNPTYKISNAQEYTWFVNRINEGNKYNAKIVSDILLTNYSDCPQISELSTVITADKLANKDKNYKIYRDSNKALIDKSDNGLIENVDFQIYASDNINDNAVLCNAATNTTIENVNISGNSVDVGGRCAAYISHSYGNTFIKNCEASINIITNNKNKSYVSVFIGQNSQNGQVTIEDCSNSGYVNSQSSSGSYAAAAIGFAESEHTSYSINNFKNYGNITSSGSGGSIIGEIDTADTVINQSYFYNLNNCYNSGRISAQNAGGFIGAITDTDPSRLSITNSENAGDIESSDKSGVSGGNSTSGGLIGYLYDGDIDVSIRNCAVTCDSIKANGQYAGGIIGFLKSDDDYTEIVNSFVYCPNIWGRDYSGILLGRNDDWNQKANNVYVYNPEWNHLKLTGDEDDSSEWHGNVTNISYDEFSDGRLAIRLNNDIGEELFGQVLDLEGQTKEKCPHINGQKIYQVERQVGEDTATVYSNYNTENAKDLLMINFINSDSSKGSSNPASNVFVKKGTDYTVNFEGFNGCALEYLYIDGKEVTDRKVYSSNQYTIKNIESNVTVKYGFGFGCKPLGLGTDEAPYEVTIPSELMWIARSLNSYTIPSDVSIHVTENIDMSGLNWEQIDYFRGSISGYISEGKNAIIYNLKQQSGNKVAFCNEIKDANIHDINISVDFSTTEDAGGLAISIADSQLTNVAVYGTIKVTSDKDPVLGGFAANGCDGNTFTRCTSSLNIYTTKEDKDTKMGGFFGRWQYYQTEGDKFVECTNNSSINSNTDADHIINGESDCAGGFVGKYQGGSEKDVYNVFESCMNVGTIIGDNPGGFIGDIDCGSGNYGNLKFNKCSNYGEITGDDAGGYIGMVGSLHNESHIYFDVCMNYGSITSPDSSAGEAGNNAGGFVGTCDAGIGSDGGGRWWYTKCGNIGTITTHGRYSGNGGMIGESQYVNRIDMDYCYSAGKQIDNNGKCRKGRLCGQSDDKDLNFNHFYFIQGLGHVGGSKRYKGNMAAGFSASDFASGKVAYLLNSNSNGNTYRQVLDNHTKISKSQGYPDPTTDLSDDSNIVYQLGDGTYSNYDPNKKKPGVEKYELHTINFEVEGPGSISPGGISHKYTGESISVTVKPNDGCVLISLILTDQHGVSEDITSKLESDNTYKLSNINCSYTIKASFSKESKPKDGDGINKPYKVTNYNELLWVATEINTGKSNINVDIMNDISAYSYNDTLWEPIGSNSTYAYTGKFNGNGHQIIGLTAYNGKEVAMFRYCNNATIVNLRLKDVCFWLSGDNKSAAGLCYSANGNTTIENVSVEGKINAAKHEAGLINFAKGNIRVDNCYTNVQMSVLFDKNSQVSGGINEINPNNGEATIRGFYVGGDNEIASNNESSGYKRSSYDHASGVVNYINGSGKVTIDSCLNFAVVKGDTAGGIAGEVKGGKLNVTFNNCSNMSRVFGNTCGGILGKTVSVSSADVKFYGCNNNGYIGITGAVIEEAGGIAGLVDDLDAHYTFENCCNYATVLNTKSDADNIAVGISSGSFALAGTLSSLFIFAAVTASAVPVASLVFCAVALVATIGGLVQTIISTRSTVLQYAGGIIGEEDSCASIKFTNVINVGAVNGTTSSNAIGEIDYQSRCKMDNVYALESACNGTDGLKGVQLEDLYAFTSGKVGYKLQENSKDLYGGCCFSQRIDKFDKGARETVPTFSNNITTIYKYDDIYTNFSKEEFKDEYYSLDVEYYSPDGSLSSNDISSFITTEVAGDRLPQHDKIDTVVNTNVNEDSSGSKQTVCTDKFSVYSAEINTVKVEPKDNTSTVVKVELLDYSNNSIALSNNEIVYNPDGSADIILSQRANQNRKIKVYCVKNGTHTESVDNKTIVMLPWNSNDKLPDESYGYYCNNYYLTQDITAQNPFVCMEGEVNICLDGKAVTMQNDTQSIVVNKQTSSLNIFDCNTSKTLHKYQLDSHGNVSVVEKADKDASDKAYNNTLFVDKIDTNSKLIKGGIILALNCTSPLIDVSYGACRVEDVTLINSNNTSAAVLFSAPYNEVQEEKASQSDKPSQNTTSGMQNAIENDIKEEIKKGNYGEEAKAALEYVAENSSSKSESVDNKQYKQVKSQLIFNATIFNSKSEVSAICYSNNNVDKLAPFTIGSNAKFVNNSCADIKTAAEIYFADDYKFEIPLSVSSFTNVTQVLTKDFDKQIEKGIDYRKVFRSFEDNKTVALSGIGNNANEVALIKNTYSDDNNQIVPYVKVNIPQGINGQVYPCNSLDEELVDNNYVKYADGSEIKLHLVTDKFNNVDKITIKRNNAVVKTYDSTYKSNMLSYGSAAEERINSGDEIIIEVSYSPQIDSVLKGDYKEWNSTITLPKTEGNYRLENDVYLGQDEDESMDVWEVPEGIFTIDLNGHNIRQTATGKNAIHVTSDKTVLTITDSSVVGKSSDQIQNATYYQKQTRQHTYNNVKTDIQTFIEVTKEDYENQKLTENVSEDDKIFEVKGGSISGANVEPQSYYAYETKAGAVLVDGGVFYMHAGNIVGNNAGPLHLGSGVFNDAEVNNNNQGVEGGAAITVGKGAYAFVYKDANIAYNSITGDESYNSTKFSGAIQCDGGLENYGNITNNVSYGWASSAIEVDTSAHFVNKGIISNNSCKNDSLGAVCNVGDFINYGQIINNLSENSYTGVANYGTFEIQESNLIADNTFINKTDKDKIEKSDIYLLDSSKVKVNENIKASQPSVVRFDDNRKNGFTSNWKRINVDPNSLFASSEEDMVACMDGFCEVKFAKKDETINVTFEKLGNGNVEIDEYSPKDGIYAKGTTIILDITADEAWSIDAVMVNGKQEIQVNSSNDKSKISRDTEKQQEDVKDDKLAKEKSGKYVIPNMDEDTIASIYFVSDKELASRGDATAWRYNNSLPNNSGKYIMKTDVTLTDDWVAPKGDIEIDLNGHNIVQSKENTPAIKIDKPLTKLVINDSAQDYIQTFTYNSDHKIIPDENGNIVIYGGYIGGCCIKDSNCLGSIVVSSGELFVKGGNIAFNQSNNSQGASAIYAEKKIKDSNSKVSLGEKAKVVYNKAINGCSAAGRFDNVELHNSGSISDNFSGKYSYPGLSFFGENGKIFLSDSSSINGNKRVANENTASVIENIDLLFNTYVANPITIASQYPNPKEYGGNAICIKLNEDALMRNDGEVMPTSVVSGFDKLQCSINEIADYFKSVDDNYTISYNSNDRLDYSPVNKTMTLNFANNMGGAVNCNGAYVYTQNSGCEISYKAEASVSQGCKLKSVNYDEKSVNLQSDESYEFKTTNNNGELSKLFSLESNTHYIVTTFEQENIDVKLSMSSNDDVKVWKDARSMPTESGNYRLELPYSTTFLTTTWEIPQNTKICLDLNGYTLKSECEGTLVKLNKNSTLAIQDSKQFTHKFDKSDNGRYNLSETRGSISLQGGLILGFINSQRTNAFEVAKDAELSLSGVNIVGFEHTHLVDPKVNNGLYVNNVPACAGAIYNEGKVTLDKDCSICGNIADCSGAIYNNKGSVITNARITDNEALLQAGGIYNDGILMLAQSSDIYDNKVVDINNNLTVTKVEDIAINSSDVNSQPQIVTNEKFDEVHKTFVSTTSNSWFYNVPVVKNAIRVFNVLSEFLNYFVLTDNSKEFVVIGEDVTIK